MFAKATSNFLKEIDAGGDLIPVKNLNESDKVQLLSLVAKKKRFWFWQKPKYQFLSLTLGDVLTEDQFVNPVVMESDFVKYESKFKNHMTGAIETALGKVTLNVGGKGLVESQSSFGTLRKQEVDLQQLIRNAAERTINLKEPVLQQVLKRRNEVLCIVTQKIVTTQKCLISEHLQIEETCGGIVGIQTKTIQVFAKEDGNLIQDSNVVLEIPTSTTIAYGVTDLYVTLDGQFEFCLLQGKCGGFEQKKRSYSVDMTPMAYRMMTQLDTLDAAQDKSSPEEPLSALKPVNLLLEKDFQPFVELPEQQQTALRTLLQAALLDDELLMVLDRVFDDVVRGLSPPPEVLEELKPPQQQDVTAFLQLVGCSLQGREREHKDVQDNKELFSTIYFLISALAEMPDNSAALLAACCELQLMPTLCHLLRALSANGSSDLDDPALAPLRDVERFGIAQRLFASAGIRLERVQASVSVSILQDPHFFPLLLCISLNGLCAQGSGHE
ncbi:gasdermin-E [Tenrec ecaudatus]|uniref:gasdermin-E n=1 Tax=Tenrec ecaudatus TaxID=94439 RepID=UPI003F5954BC